MKPIMLPQGRDSRYTSESVSWFRTGDILA
jgi:hypothetical protein